MRRLQPAMMSRWCRLGPIVRHPYIQKAMVCEVLAPRLKELKDIDCILYLDADILLAKPIAPLISFPQRGLRAFGEGNHLVADRFFRESLTSEEIEPDFEMIKFPYYPFCLSSRL